MQCFLLIKKSYVLLCQLILERRESIILLLPNVMRHTHKNLKTNCDHPAPIYPIYWIWCFFSDLWYLCKWWFSCHPSFL